MAVGGEDLGVGWGLAGGGGVRAGGGLGVCELARVAETEGGGRGVSNRPLRRGVSEVRAGANPRVLGPDFEEFDRLCGEAGTRRLEGDVALAEFGLGKERGDQLGARG